MPTIATAGHIDHGKSTLIKALTGQEPDRLAEEKTRGMTIDLGFAWMDLDSGEKLAFVDVPGHQKFIGTMLAGAGSVSAVLFVVSATEKMMPQSWEHLHIMEILGVRHGVVAVTKTGGMSQTEQDRAADEIRKALAGSFLENVELVRVDSVDGTGLEEIRKALNGLIAKLPPAENLGRPRLWVDRSFTASGSGTVITGTLTLGDITTGDELNFSGKAGKKLKVRAIQSLGRAEETTAPNTRTALNLTGVSKDEIGRGDVLVQEADWFMTKTFDVGIKVLDGAHKISRRGAYVVHLGSGDFPARIAVLGATSVAPGAEGFIRIFIETELPLKPGDRYVLRDTGRRLISGGGEILDLDPVLPVSNAAPDKSLRRILSERGGWLATSELELLAGGKAPIEDGAEAKSENGEKIQQIDKWFVLESRLTEIESQLTQKLTSAGPNGLDITDLLESDGKPDGISDKDAYKELGRAVLGKMDGVSFEGGRAYLGAAPDLTSHPFIHLLDEAPFSPPDPKGEISKEALSALVSQKLVINAGGIFFSAAAVKKAVQLLDELFTEKEKEKETSSATVSEIRQKLGTSRKYALALMGYFDETGITRRQGDQRTPGPRFDSF